MDSMNGTRYELFIFSKCCRIIYVLWFFFL